MELQGTNIIIHGASHVTATWKPGKEELGAFCRVL